LRRKTRGEDFSWRREREERDKRDKRDRRHEIRERSLASPVPLIFY